MPAAVTKVNGQASSLTAITLTDDKGGGYTYYYKDLVRCKGLTRVGDDYYFFNKGSGSMMTGNLWIDSNDYGIAVGTHTFGADGKMVN